MRFGVKEISHRARGRKGPSGTASPLQTVVSRYPACVVDEIAPAVGLILRHVRDHGTRSTAQHEC